MANCRSDAASQVKQLLSMREVVERYGFTPDRGGYIQCPFHQGDRHGSLKIYPDTGGFHCFGCGVGGSVIDFVMKLFNLSFRQSVVRLSTDFGLNLTQHRATPTEVSELARARQREAHKKAAVAAKYPTVAAEYRYCFEITKYCSPILMPDGEIWVHPLYASAINEMPQLEWWLNQNMGR